MIAADARREAGSAPAALVARTVGVLVAAVLLVGLVGGASELAHRLLGRRAVVVESYAFLSRSVAHPAGPLGGSGRPAGSAAVVLLRSVSRWFMASQVVVSEAPRSAFADRPTSATVPVIYPDQTVAVILATARPNGPYRIRVAVGRWRTPAAGAAVLPDVTWRRGAGGIEARVSNLSRQAAPAVRLVGVFFGRVGNPVAVGAQPVGAVPPLTSRVVAIPIRYGSVPRRARAALFEEGS
ncbi:MAG: hypothetical protein M0Z42_16675 [Actinomycetota bacterium]|jgi:hypothetical protein|nr:hypothetical protein [Actinomycetota bacterium]